MATMVEDKPKVEPKKKTFGSGSVETGLGNYEIEERTSYLIEEPKPTLAFRIFNHQLSEGRNGLCITRQNPKRLRKKFNWKKIPIIWLTNNNLENEHCIDPTNLSRLTSEIINFIKDTSNGIVLLEGLEYLISQNSYQFILRFIQLINDKIMLSNCIILFPLDRLILSEREVHLLERDMKVLE
jgi:two-component system cell cycle response regulator